MGRAERGVVGGELTTVGRDEVGRELIGVALVKLLESNGVTSGRLLSIFFSLRWSRLLRNCDSLTKPTVVCLMYSWDVELSDDTDELSE